MIFYELIFSSKADVFRETEDTKRVNDQQILSMFGDKFRDELLKFQNVQCYF